MLIFEDLSQLSEPNIRKSNTWIHCQANFKRVSEILKAIPREFHPNCGMSKRSCCHFRKLKKIVRFTTVIKLFLISKRHVYKKYLSAAKTLDNKM